MNSHKTQNGDRQHNSSITHDERQRQNWTVARHRTMTVNKTMNSRKTQNRNRQEKQ